MADVFRRLDVAMKRVAASLAVLATCACAAMPDDAGLDGLWTLRVRKSDHPRAAVATIRFTGDPAPSCIGGDWKRVVVDSVTNADADVFPLSDPLSYRMDGPELIIGRNGICDGYLRLHGELRAGAVRGSYDAFGMRGGQALGDFTLDRGP